jgi:hypothetical protein
MGGGEAGGSGRRFSVRVQVRNLIFDGGFEQGYAQGEAAREALSHEQLDLAFQQGHAAALTDRAVAAHGEAFEEGYRKGKGKGREKGFGDGWEALQELRVAPGVHAYLSRLVDADEARLKAMGDLAWRSIAFEACGARTLLADIEPKAPDREEAAGMLEALRRARTRSPRAVRNLAEHRQARAGF